MRLALVFALSLSPPPGRDGWFGRDKVKHFVAASAIQSVAYAAWHRGETGRTAALWRATGVTATASLGKEVLDRRTGGRFSVRDLAWDAGGAGVATLAIIQRSRN